VRPFLPSLAENPALPPDQTIAQDRVLDLTNRLAPDGQLLWDVPPGDWTIWCEPWEINVPASILKKGLNTLELVVANLWTNRLVGDSGLPIDQRITWTPDGPPLRPESPLQSSGLLGPVTLKVAKGRD
jgi:hypothetical protein